MNTRQHSLRAARRDDDRLRATTLPAVVTALLFAALSMPASAGTTQVSGAGVFNDGCQPQVGSPPANLGDYPPIQMAGSLEGCWYTYVSLLRDNPSGTIVEQGTELFIGCLDGDKCGTFETTYTFTGKFDESGNEQHGRCQHSIVGGTDAFAGAKGVINMKDDLVNLEFDYRGQIMLASPDAQSAAAARQAAATESEADGSTSGGC